MWIVRFSWGCWAWHAEWRSWCVGKWWPLPIDSSWFAQIHYFCRISQSRIEPNLAQIESSRLLIIIFIPWKHNNWRPFCDLTKRIVLYAWKHHFEVHLVNNQRNLVIVRKSQYLLHVCLRKDCAHWIGRINDEHERSFISYQGSRMFEVYLKVAVLFEFIGKCFSAESWKEIVIKWISDLRHKDFIS